MACQETVTMKPFLTLATCAILLGGCDFVGATNASPVAIASLTILDAPLPIEEDGTAPDLYVEVQDASGRAIVQAPAIREDADASMLPYQIAGGTLYGASRFTVVVMDWDEDRYEVLATSRVFSLADMRANAGSSFEVRDEAGTLRAEIALTP